MTDEGITDTKRLKQGANWQAFTSSIRAITGEAKPAGSAGPPAATIIQTVSNCTWTKSVTKNKP